MFKTVLFTVAMALSAITANAQDLTLDKTVRADEILQLQRSFGLPFQDAVDGRPALLVLSLGCSHCIELATRYQDGLKQYFKDNNLEVSLIEMPQAISRGPDALIKDAQRAAGTASLLFECSSGKSADSLLGLMAALGSAAKAIVGDTPDPNAAETTNWANWVYLATANEEDALQSAAMTALGRVVANSNVDRASCGKQGEGERMRVRLTALRDFNVIEVPVLYLLPDENHAELEVISSTALTAIGRSNQSSP
ncbi:MAG: hypothetical protein AB8F65_04225 [Woeseiaceae bacterium]